MRDVSIIAAPFHAGAYNEAVGAGPLRLLEDGIESQLRTEGLSTALARVDPVDLFEGEIGRTFEIKRRVAERVAKAVSAGAFPLILAGNCNTSVGVAAGLRDREAGAIWFDAHPDFDTPDEHRSGYFDGMGLATLTGSCWRNLAASVPSFAPIPADRLLLCGIRDFEPGQREKVEAAGIRAVIGSTTARTDYVGGFSDLLASVPFARAMIHVDLDCLDTDVGRANRFAAPGGLNRDQLLGCLRLACSAVTPLSLTLASFDPALEGSERISAIAIEAAALVAQHAAAIPPSGMLAAP